MSENYESNPDEWFAYILSDCALDGEEMPELMKAFPDYSIDWNAVARAVAERPDSIKWGSFFDFYPEVDQNLVIDLIIARLLDPSIPKFDNYGYEILDAERFAMLLFNWEHMDRAEEALEALVAAGYHHEMLEEAIELFDGEEPNWIDPERFSEIMSGVKL